MGYSCRHPWQTHADAAFSSLLIAGGEHGAPVRSSEEKCQKEGGPYGSDAMRACDTMQNGRLYPSLPALCFISALHAWLPQAKKRAAEAAAEAAALGEVPPE